MESQRWGGREGRGQRGGRRGCGGKESGQPQAASRSLRAWVVRILDPRSPWTMLLPVPESEPQVHIVCPHSSYHSIGDIATTQYLQTTVATGALRPHPAPSRRTPSDKLTHSKFVIKEHLVKTSGAFPFGTQKRHCVLLRYIKIPNKQASPTPHCVSTGRLSRGIYAEQSSHQKDSLRRSPEGSTCSKEMTESQDSRDTEYQKMESIFFSTS